ncbi:lysozyme [Novosphingobium sp. KCTC 2891]|uniref:lysozyme n=1 Tax=Novosphingobium sp. KCTC 2891 TaxID=2989730 RepID=UPI0022226C22|nr:lysozyme [Novosphingobium sp. KCTC 2891]MCW1381250.1 lysozyme [Novosphingobium sp. KCTC 2891]
MNRKPIFDAVRTMLGRPFTGAEIETLDRAIDAPSIPAPVRTLGAAGTALIKKWEGCHRLRADGRFDAYPDPGSSDGHPWTIGWGSTGPDIARGTIWTKAECDARFDHDMARYVADVVRTLGAVPTTQNQFDALVSFHYNTGAIATAGLVRLHRQGRQAEAAQQFDRWVHNDGKVMTGLVRRRADEARLYRSA